VLDKRDARLYVFQPNGELIDHMTYDGLTSTFTHRIMAEENSVVSAEIGCSRADQDAWALRSHQRAVAAIDDGSLADEIVPVTISGRKGDTVVDTDEGPRRDTSAERLASLKPVFTDDGATTAGNAPGVNDGASALVVMSGRRARDLGLSPLARIVGQATSGLAPKFVLMTPVDAVRRLLDKTGWALGDVDLFELNEAFSVQAVAVLNELGLDPAKVNVNGGAVALGHAIGSSGSRVLTTLLYALQQRNLRRGVATLCLGGGNGVALAVERI